MEHFTGVDIPLNLQAQKGSDDYRHGMVRWRWGTGGPKLGEQIRAYGLLNPPLTPHKCKPQPPHPM